MDANLKIAAAAGNKLNGELPEELIEDILLRLPVKSLIRFGCVCKSWLSLISSNQFVRKHLNSNSNSFRCAAVLPRSRRFSSNSIFSISSSPQPQDEERVTELTAPIVGNEFYYISGHCEGLLLLVGKYDNKINTIIWNPSINKYRILPVIANEFPGLVLSSQAFGLGYDPSIDDYNVVWVQTTYSDTKVYILALKTNTWRRVDCVVNQSVFPAGDQFVCDNNGCIYWINANYRYGLLRFDLVEEEFRLIPTPPNILEHVLQGGIDDDILTIVQVFLGSSATICLEYIRVYENSNEVWVANLETGWTWIKLSTVPNLHCKPENRLLCLTRSGKILFMPNYDNLAIYDHDQNSLRKLAIHDRRAQRRRRIRYHAIPYIQSLVSP